LNYRKILQSFFAKSFLATVPTFLLQKTMMTYNKFHTNCPHFKVGNCSSYKNGVCKYKYHKTCDENFLCNREDCKFGHGISYTKRVIINYIYDEKYSSASGYEDSDNKCKMPMICINKDCECDHHIEYDARSFIYNISNPTISDDNAWSNYEKKYSSYSPASSTMSSSSTVPAMCSPCPVVSSSPPPLSGSFASLFTEAGVEAKVEAEADTMMAIIETMKNIRNNITGDTKKVVSIKEQIKKLQEDLSKTEEKIKKDKNNLKELAVKIAEC